MNCNKGNRAALKEIYNGSSNYGVKKIIFQGWLMCGAKEDVVAAGS